MDVKMKKFGVNYGEFTSDYYVYSLINKLKEISFDSDEILIDYIFDEDEVVHSDEFKLIIRDVAIEIIGDEIEYVTVKDRKSTRLNSSHVSISYAVFC